MITSKQNPLIKEIKSLQDKKFRDKLGLYVALGIKLTKEAFLMQQQVKYVICTEQASELLGELPIEKTIVSEQVFAVLSEEKTPQGALAVIEKPNQQFAKSKSSCILLDGVSDAGNVGAIIRTAVASGYSDVYLVDCADCFSPKAVRASMSGIYTARTYLTTREEVIEKLNLPFLVADMGGENVFNANISCEFCLVVGSEAHGVSEKLKNVADYTVKIPMDRGIESLNVAVSAGIIMYALKNK